MLKVEMKTLMKMFGNVDHDDDDEFNPDTDETSCLTCLTCLTRLENKNKRDAVLGIDIYRYDIAFHGHQIIPNVCFPQFGCFFGKVQRGGGMSSPIQKMSLQICAYLRFFAEKNAMKFLKI